MTENTLITKGRFKNTTYGDALKKDPKYCADVRKAAEEGRHCSVEQDFVKFLLSIPEEDLKTSTRSFAKVDESHKKQSEEFLKKLTPEIRHEFKTLVGEPPIKEREIHAPYSGDHSNGIQAVFYRNFIRKCVSNLRDEDCSTGMREYASVFPFEVNAEKKNRREIDILAILRNRDDFRQEIQTFLNSHFDDVTFDEVVSTFLSNIDNFQYDNGIDLEYLEKILETDKNIHDLIQQNLYLRNFKRLSRAGISRFLSMYDVFSRIANKQNEPVGEITRTDLYKLPERNMHDLCSLLDVKLFHDDFPVYTKRFQKYLFFFVGALKNHKKVVCFIDDILYESLKSLRTFEKSRSPVLDLLYDLQMLSLVKRREQYESQSSLDYEIDGNHLQNVKTYIENFPNIETARVNFEIPESKSIKCKAFLYLDDASIDVKFCSSRKSFRRELNNMILMAALCEDPVIKRLVVYNAYKGIEYTMSLDNIDRAAIKAFFHKYDVQVVNENQSLPRQCMYIA